MRVRALKRDSPEARVPGMFSNHKSRMYINHLLKRSCEVYLTGLCTFKAPMPSTLRTHSQQ